MRVRGQQTQHKKVSVVERQSAKLVTSDDAADAGDGRLITDDGSRPSGRRSCRCGRTACRRFTAGCGTECNGFAERGQDLALVTNVDFNILAWLADLRAVRLAGGDLISDGGRDAGDGEVNVGDE